MTGLANAIIDTGTLMEASLYDGNTSTLNNNEAFTQLLHAIILYDRIITPDLITGLSSLERGPVQFTSRFNILAGEEIFLLNKNLKISEPNKAFANFCRYIVKGISRGLFSQEDLVGTSFSEYRGKYWQHRQNQMFECGLKDELHQFVRFTFSGILYLSRAKSLEKELEMTCCYLASPARLLALKKILNAEDFAKIEFPVKKYGKLVDCLDLPSYGYDFSEFSTFDSPITKLSLVCESLSPNDSIAHALELRNSPEVKKLRKNWSELVQLGGSPTTGVAVNNQSISNSVIQGSVNMFIGTPLERKNEQPRRHLFESLFNFKRSNSG